MFEEKKSVYTAVAWISAFFHGVCLCIQSQLFDPPKRSSTLEACRIVKKKQNWTLESQKIEYLSNHIIEHYKEVERSMLNYYSLTNNYKNLTVTMAYYLY